jgi:hypothetical protein
MGGVAGGSWRVKSRPPIFRMVQVSIKLCQYYAGSLCWLFLKTVPGPSPELIPSININHKFR